MRPGDKVRLVCNPAIILTVKRVSPHVEMIEIEEVEGWGWTYGYVPADIGKELAERVALTNAMEHQNRLDSCATEPDFIDDQLKFLES